MGCRHVDLLGAGEIRLISPLGVSLPKKFKNRFVSLYISVYYVCVPIGVSLL